MVGVCGVWFCSAPTDDLALLAVPRGSEVHLRHALPRGCPFGTVRKILDRFSRFWYVRFETLHVTWMLDSPSCGLTLHATWRPLLLQFRRFWIDVQDFGTDLQILDRLPINPKLNAILFIALLYLEIERHRR